MIVEPDSVKAGAVIYDSSIKIHMIAVSSLTTLGLLATFCVTGTIVVANIFRLVITK